MNISKNVNNKDDSFVYTGGSVLRYLKKYDKF